MQRGCIFFPCGSFLACLSSPLPFQGLFLQGGCCSAVMAGAGVSLLWYDPGCPAATLSTLVVVSLLGSSDPCCNLSKIVWQFHSDCEAWRLLACRNWGFTKRQDLGGRKVVPDCWVYRLWAGFIYGFHCGFILLPGRAGVAWCHRHGDSGWCRELWGTQLGAAAGTEGLEGLQQLRVKCHRHIQVVTRAPSAELPPCKGKMSWCSDPVGDLSPASWAECSLSIYVLCHQELRKPGVGSARAGWGKLSSPPWAWWWCQYCSPGWLSCRHWELIIVGAVQEFFATLTKATLAEQYLVSLWLSNRAEVLIFSLLLLAVNCSVQPLKDQCWWSKRDWCSCSHCGTAGVAVGPCGDTQSGSA